MRKQDLSVDRQKLLVPVETAPGAFALIPPPVPRSLPLEGIAQPLFEAHEALAKMQEAASRLPNPYLITRTLDRREAVKSSQIEGTHADVDGLLEYEATGDAEGLPPDVAVTLNYVKALEYGLEQVRESGVQSITTNLVRELHRVLMEGEESYRDVPGEYRSIQNWIGAYRIYDARFVPPPAGKVQPAMEDLLDFMRYEPEGVVHTSVVARMAIAHAQFETIHPFRDGNGRTGRLLMPIMLAAEGYPPIYLAGFLKEHQSIYYDSLLAVQLRGDWKGWIRFLADGVVAACRESGVLAKDLLELQAAWQDRVSGLRADALAHKLVDYLMAKPVVTANQVKDDFSVSFPTANSALEQLTQFGILAEPRRKRNRVFVADEVITILKSAPSHEEEVTTTTWRPRMR